MKLTDLLLPDRMAYVLNNKDIMALHDLICKHTGLSRSESEQKYELIADFVMHRVTVKGDPVDIFDLYTIFNRLGVEYESVTQASLRIDISKFINTVL